MKLVIAEKPSVARSLARVIGADKRCDGYLEGGGYLVSWCVGHLVELSAPEPFWTVQLTAGGVTAASRRFKDQAEAEKLLAACKAEGKVTVEVLETKEKAEKPPLLYDLTSLQRDAYRILGFTAQQTLDYTQSLYEKKLVTYPRTDSRYLTEDMQALIPALVKAVAGHFGLAEDSLRTEPVRKGAVFDSSKVTDHYAIIPTKTILGNEAISLSDSEKSVLQLVSVRLLCAMQEDYRYAETSIKLSCRAEEFAQKGRTVLKPGWKDIWNRFYPEKKKTDESSASLPVKGSVLDVEFAELKEGKTSPPKHFTEDTLLSAMETAGADEIPEEAERRGLGTPATRAATIEKLVQRGFIERKGEKKTRSCKQKRRRKLPPT